MSDSLRRYVIWVVVALVGAVCWGMLALSRGETINAGWLLFAAPDYLKMASMLAVAIGWYPGRAFA